MKQLFEWIRAMANQFVTILTGTIVAAVLAIEPYFLRTTSRWPAAVALLISLLWAGFRTWKQQRDRCAHLQNLLITEWIERMKRLRREVSASSSVEWSSDEKEEQYYISKFDDAETAQIAFRRWKEKFDNARPAPVIRFVESPWMRRTRSFWS